MESNNGKCYKSGKAWLRRNILSIILISVVCTGCANTRQRGELWSYGNYCGKGVPATDGLSRQAARKILENTPVYDSIDEICKYHDICYFEGRKPKYLCDELLSYQMERMNNRFSEEENRRCNRVTKQVWIAFYCGKQIFNFIFDPDKNNHYDPGHIFAHLIQFGIPLFGCTVITALELLYEIFEQPPSEAGKCNTG